MGLIRNKCQNNNRCSFMGVDLNHEHFNNMEGVYVIRHGGQKPATVRVGQGIIKDRIAEHRENPEIVKYNTAYGCYVTWAKVDAAYRDGVEAYLANALDPIVGERFPNVRQIPVDLPW